VSTCMLCGYSCDAGATRCNSCADGARLLYEEYVQPKNSSWHRACAEPLTVPDTENPGEMMEPEPGTRYFIRQLQRIGARSLSSCEGHAPDWHWYVSFDASYETALAVQAAGYFAVSLHSSRGAYPCWVLETSHIDRSESHRDTILAMASKEWDTIFGALPGHKP
jgi:hypothetical protein